MTPRPLAPPPDKTPAIQTSSARLKCSPFVFIILTSPSIIFLSGFPSLLRHLSFLQWRWIGSDYALDYEDKYEYEYDNDDDDDKEEENIEEKIE